MAEDLITLQGTKEEMYRGLIPQIKGLISFETDATANMGNICAALKETFNFFWVGFYLVQLDALVLGAFQGPVACTRIHKGKGVCGTVWETEKALIVPDVDAFPGHIACSSLSKSEIVIPIMKENKIIGVLDVDSSSLNDFDETDLHFLSEICQCLVETL